MRDGWTRKGPLDRIKSFWRFYLPNDGLPRVLMQQVPVSGHGAEESLAGGFPHGRPVVDAQVAQFSVEAHPQFVEGRHVRHAGKVGEHFGLLLVQRHAQHLAVFVEIVGNVPLKTKYPMWWADQRYKYKPWNPVTINEIRSNSMKRWQGLRTIKPMAVRATLSSCVCDPNLPVVSTASGRQFQGNTGM